MDADLTRPATYGDLQKLDQKVDRLAERLDQKTDNIAAAYARLRGDMIDMKEEILEAIRQSNHNLMGAILKFYGDVKSVDDRGVVLKERVGKLEERMDSVEEKLQ